MKRRNFIKKGGLGLAGLGLAASSEAASGASSSAEKKDLKKLSDTFEQSPVVETYQCTHRVRSGVALGGIGTGSIELRKDGNFYNWSIFNNYPLGTGPHFDLPAWPGDSPEASYLFFLVRYQVEGESPKMKILQLNDTLGEGGMDGILYYYPWMSGVDQIEYAGRFPFVNIRYTDSEMPLEIELEAFSPFIPHDVKNSSLPLIYFNFNIRSKSDKPVDVLLIGTLRNLVGYDEINKYFISDMVDQPNHKFFLQTVGGMDTQRSSYGHMGLGAIGGDEVSYYLGWAHKHPYYEKLLVSKRFSNFDDTANRNTKTEDGQPIAWLVRDVNDQKLNSSIGVNKRLGKGEEFQSTMMMSWYFPNRYGAVNDGKKRANNKPVAGSYEVGIKPTKLIGHYYQRNFSSIKEVVSYGFSEYKTLRDRSLHFLQGLYATSVDQFILDQINAQCNTFATSSTLTKAGKFGIREGLSASKSWGPNVTIDVSLYGSVMVLGLFPELQKNMMRAHRDLQTPNGEIHHGLGYDLDFTQNGTWGVFHRVDLVPNYIQLVLRDYFWTNDLDYLKEMWPSVKKGIQYVLKERDKNGDQMPDMEGIMCSYDNFPMYGLASYIQSQWIVALQLAARAAKDMGESSLQQEYQRIADKGKQLMEDKLWNGAYFRLANDYNGEKGIDEGCLTDQLVGQWVAHCAGVGHILSPEKVKLAIQNILDYSFMEGRFLRNCTWPEHRDLFPIHETNLWVDQANMPWTGVELAFASFLIFEGMLEEGKKVIKAVDDRYRRDGLYWDHQEFGGHYYRPMAAWAILNALSGLTIFKQEYSFNPKLENNQTNQYFFSASSGTGHFIQQKNGQITIQTHAGQLDMKALSLPAKMWMSGEKTILSFNGNPISIEEWQSENGQLKAFFKAPLTLQIGEALVIG